MPEDREAFLGDIANDADGEAWTRERLAPDHAFRHAELDAHLTHLVLEQQTEGLTELEVHVVWEAANVVVRLDLRGGLRSRLDHIRVERALDEKLDALEALRLVLEYSNKRLTDDLALLLGIGDAREQIEKATLCLYVHERHLVVRAKRLDDLLGFALSQHPMIDEDAGELIAHGSMNQQCGHGRVNATGQATEDLLIADLSTNSSDLLVDYMLGRPGAVLTTDVVGEALEHVGTGGSVNDLRVELDRVELALDVFHGGNRRARCAGSGAKPGRHGDHRVVVAHPARVRRRKALEQHRIGLDFELGLAELSRSTTSDFASERLRHRLHAVTNPKHGNAKLEDGRVQSGRVGLVDAGGTARQHDSDGITGRNLGHGHVVGNQLGQHAPLANAPSDQLRVLSPEVKDDDWSVGRHR